MDQTLAAGYRWINLDLCHGFDENEHGLRRTISESDGRTLLARLLALNHQRYEEEGKAGLHDKGVKKRRKGKRQPAGEQELSLL